MNLKKDLPELFEEFADARKNAFIAVKELKDKGVPLVGAFCTFMPSEIPMAMGAVVVGLCSKSEETIQESEKYLPKNLCPLIKASYGYAITDKCPFFYFSDIVIGETTCDGKKKMYEYLSQIKPTYILQLPNSPIGNNNLVFWKNEIISYKNKLESFFNTTITDEQIRNAIKLNNKERNVLKELYNLAKLNPSPIDGSKMFNIIYGSKYKFDKEKTILEIGDIVKTIKSEYNASNFVKKPRILVTGSPISGVSEKLFKAIEDANACVVAFENCVGAKNVNENVDETMEDVYEALARKYINIGCSCMSPNPRRLELIENMVKEYQVDGVIDVVLTACHTYSVESFMIKQLVENKLNKPYISIETDYSQSDIEQLNTRITAFVEILQDI